ncbi:aldolase [Cupriavidus plantarum]|uniref:L-fuculose-phosphate aldolase n=1 Tax=Cupriavidus plantarum TaxID=942865 RepID=A0A316F4A4_9BURK|nr:aldolase [Cupriavidus plantarum]PWK38905.1 L-fuculose-phosphate aldolase [Cupriavidus plantarum]CAG2150559.1 L-fuculose phosphate aldolase [Cupriavidus plantarum]SMR67903.1 L-fuculose-phosphate aldolase [Cupriavidus plantarum]
MNAPLRDKSYFDTRATTEMARHLRSKPRTMQETMAYACRILAMTEQEAGLAGQISVRSERPGAYWTLRFGLGFDEATPQDFIEVDRDLNTLTGDGMPNPATRFHLWVYDARPDVNAIIHTHSPWASALAAARQPLVIAQMDMTPLHDDCAFLGEWPGVPIADQEGVIISEALGSKRAIILAHHGYLTAGKTCEEATYLSVYLERAARLQIRAQAFGPLTPVDDALAREAHDYLLKPSIVNATFAYWARQTHGVPPLPAA